MIKNFSALIAAMLLATPLLAADGPATILSTKVICRQPDRYIGWPSIARTRSGELLVVFSGDRDAHVCPWGKTQMIRSSDNGQSWTDPVTINNTPLDDRDPGILETPDGALLVSWFTSLAFDRPGNPWSRHADKLSEDVRRQYMGNWIRRSTDAGQTWSDPIDSIVSTPHGPVALADGRLLYIGKNHHVGNPHGTLPPDDQLLAVAESLDNGRTWNILSYIPVPPEVQPGPSAFHEPHLVETSTNNFIAMFRHHGQPGQYYLWQTESTDAGRSWTPLRQTPIWGYPPHLLRLTNGWLIVTYGRRKPPFSERACISRDGGKTWDTENEITLSDAHNGDLGYPASAALHDGSIYTIYYQVEHPGEKTCLMATHWRLNDLPASDEQPPPTASPAP